MKKFILYLLASLIYLEINLCILTHHIFHFYVGELFTAIFLVKFASYMMEDLDNEV